MHFIISSSLLLGAVLGAFAQPTDPAAEADLVAKLLTAPTQVQRLNLLNDTDFVFDFNGTVGVSKGAGGKITTANAADFPAVIGNGMAMAVGVMEPCGENTPHTHPRATEFLYVVDGSQLEVGFIEENGARIVTNTISPGQGTIFPKGSIHFQQNLGCKPLTFVAALNNVDPGVLSAAQRYFGLPPDVVAASLGQVGLKEVSNLALNIPDNVAVGVQSCLDRCGLKRGTQPMEQLQPRISGNAIPSGVSSVYPSPSKRSVAKRSVEIEDAGVASGSYIPKSGAATIEDMVFMLRVLIGVMLLGYVAIGATCLVRRRRAQALPTVPYSDTMTKA